MKLDYVAHRYTPRTNRSKYVELRIDPDLCSPEHIKAARELCERTVDEPSEVDRAVTALLCYRDYLLDLAIARGHREECSAIIVEYDRKILAVRDTQV